MESRSTQIAVFIDAGNLWNVYKDLGRLLDLEKLEDLTINVRTYLGRIQFNEAKIMNFFKKDEVAYAAW